MEQSERPSERCRCATICAAGFAAAAVSLLASSLTGPADTAADPRHAPPPLAAPPPEPPVAAPAAKAVLEVDPSELLDELKEGQRVRAVQPLRVPNLAPHQRRRYWVVPAGTVGYVARLQPGSTLADGKAIGKVHFAGIGHAEARRGELVNAPPGGGQPCTGSAPPYDSAAAAKPGGLPAAAGMPAGQRLRLLVSTTLYGDGLKRQQYLQRVLEQLWAFCTAGATVSFTLDSTSDWRHVTGEHLRCSGEKRPHVLRRWHPEVKFELVALHHSLWAQRKDEFDWFLFVEDDLGLTTQHLALLLDGHRRLSGTGFAPGLVRYERFPEAPSRDSWGRGSFLTDFASCRQNGRQPLVAALWCIRGELWLEAAHKYAAHTLVPRAQLPTVLELWREQGLLADGPTGRQWLEREPQTHAWPPWYDIQSNRSIQRCNPRPDATLPCIVVPLRRFPQSLVRHLTDEYVVRETAPRSNRWPALVAAGDLWECLGMQATEGNSTAELVPDPGASKQLASWGFDDAGRVTSDAFPMWLEYRNGFLTWAAEHVHNVQARCAASGHPPPVLPCPKVRYKNGKPVAVARGSGGKGWKSCIKHGGRTWGADCKNTPLTFMKAGWGGIEWDRALNFTKLSEMAEEGRRRNVSHEALWNRTAIMQRLD